MPRQLSIFDEGPPDGDERPDVAPVDVPPRDPSVRHTLFLALSLDAAQAPAMAATGARLARQFAPGSRPVEAQRLHVSLYALASEVEALPRSLVDLGLRAGARVERPAFDVVFDRVARFGAGALVLACASPDALGELHAFRASLGIALADAGFPVTTAKITPHMTIAYGARERVDVAVEPVRWRATGFVLIHSHVGAHRHDVLGRWPLAA